MDGDGDEDDGVDDDEDSEILTDRKEPNMEPWCEKVEQKMKIECQATMSGQVERLQNSETVP